MCSSLRRVSTRSVMGAALMALIALPAAAQSVLERPTAPANTDPNAQATPAQPRTVVRRAIANAVAQQGGNLDAQIAACMLLGNQEEVALAQFAEQRAQNPEVKKFAQQMIEHHQQALAKIEQASPQVASLQLHLGGTAAGAQPGADQANRNQAASAQHQGIQLVKAVKQQCLELTEKELGAHQGAEFDKAYIGQQVGAHLGMLAQLRGSRDFASAELQPVIAESEKVTESHLAEAKKIMQQIKDQGSQPQTTQRPVAATRPVR